ncbi:MAG: hypothetical protein PHY72_00785 [Candidatus Pacebacteria bacterium]|nr:hypothetical protein [Candidatus Paceibacterota bacterium]
MTKSYLSGEKISLKPGAYSCLDDPHLKFFIEKVATPVKVTIIEALPNVVIANASNSKKNSVRIAVRDDSVIA